MFDEFIKVLKKQLTRYYKRVYSNPGEQNKQPGNEQAPQTLIRSGDPLVIPISHMELITRFFLQQVFTHIYIYISYNLLDLNNDYNYILNDFRILFNRTTPTKT